MEMTKRKYRLLILSTSILLIVCIVLSVSLIKKNRKFKNLETKFMQQVYYEIYFNLYDPLNTSNVYEAPENARYAILSSLRRVDSMLTTGYNLLSHDVPDGFYRYAFYMDVKINRDAFSKENGELSEEGETILTQLSEDMHRLLKPLQGEDGRNFNYELTMKEFQEAFEFLEDDKYAVPE